MRTSLADAGENSGVSHLSLVTAAGMLYPELGKSCLLPEERPQQVTRRSFSSRKEVLMNTQEPSKRTFVEEIEVSGGQLVERVKELIEESSARRVIIRDKDGDELMSIPLTFGVVAGGLITLTTPLLAALGALAALVTRVKLEVIREEEEPATGEASSQEGAPSEPPSS